MAIITNIIWITSNDNNKIIYNYLKELESSKFCKNNLFYSIEESINEIKKIRFEETIIIVNGNLYIKFIEIFQKNINDIYIIPKIVIFTNNKEEFINKNKEYNKIINNPFYNSGGIKTNIDEINDFIIKPICKNKIILNKEDDKQLCFEYIDYKEKLMLPIFYKTLMEITPNDNVEEFTQLLCNKYSNKNNELDLILNSLKSVPNIPLELLSKYYTRIYTEEKSQFYSDINKDLREKKINNYLSYIKVLYEGVKLKSLPLSKDKILYRGSILSNKEIEKIKNYLKYKVKDLPSSIIFSKSFLSFSKDKNMAKYFLNMNKNNNKDFSKVLFILEKDDYSDYSLSTHADIEDLSFFQEKEVLFFPFSSFEVKDINQIYDNNEEIYEIKLLYLGKYIKELKKDINIKNNIIPDSEFKEEIIKSGLIKPQTINKETTINEIIKKYEDYKEEIKNNKNENINIKNIIKNIEKKENFKNNDINKMNLLEETKIIKEKEKFNNLENEKEEQNAKFKKVWCISYTGNFDKGLRNGNGVGYYSNGNIYEGEWVNDKKHGHGKYIFKNGDIYEGEFKNDEINGKGIFYINHDNKEAMFEGELYLGNPEYFDVYKSFLK